ncbi:MAG: DUF4919 domain-containing protein [Planctomycetaceae bacterium]|nr:DUF4919 domain-containing protein [Planctomycetaceae bacterium]
MQRRFTQFVESPTRENYLAVRDAVLRRTPLPIQAADLAELVRLLEAEAYEEVLARVELLPASKVLSPRVHYITAEAAEALGDEETGELARMLFVLSLRGLLATGDGTEAAPYAICHASDEHDLLDCLGREFASQALVERDGRLFDVVTCADGRQVWFDATAVFCRPKSPSGKRRRKSTARGGHRRRRRQLPAASIQIRR